MRKTVLFFRVFKRLSGGDVKVWHYFNHVLASPAHRPLISFSRGSVWDESNPWRDHREHVVPGNVRSADVLFVSGSDWLRLPLAERRSSSVPVIHLVQGLRAHTEPTASGYGFLPFRAIRISVGEELTEALDATGRINGPLFTIPSAIDASEVRALAGEAKRDIDLLIVATKAAPYPGVPGVLDSPPALGRALLPRLAGPNRRVELIDGQLSRPEFLRLVRRARVTLFLPYRVEACPLAPLEGMATGTLVVCPDCVGNRSYCIPGWNAFRPEYEEEAIVAAAEEALAGAESLAPLMAERAAATLRERDLGAERTAFLDVLDRAEELWREAWPRQPAS